MYSMIIYDIIGHDAGKVKISVRSGGCGPINTLSLFRYGIESVEVFFALHQFLKGALLLDPPVLQNQYFVVLLQHLANELVGDMDNEFVFFFKDYLTLSLSLPNSP